MNIERTDRVNWSTLKTVGISPRHYLYALANPRADTEALLLGRVLHCMVLEPDEYSRRYIVEPRFNRACNDDTARSKGYNGGKQSAAAWLENVGEREVVTATIDATARGMAESIMSDPVALPIITSGHAEHRIEWTDEATGIECRGRVDRVNGILSDLKSTRSLIGFKTDSARFGYNSQIAWYLDGLKAAGIETDPVPRLIAVENCAPFDVVVFRVNARELDAGRKVYRGCLKRLAECRRTGMWPGFANGAEMDLVLPEWANPIEDELTIDGEPLK